METNGNIPIQSSSVLEVHRKQPSLLSLQQQKEKRRTKIRLKKGRSLMDWIRYTKTIDRNLSGVEKVQKVTASDMMNHACKENAWMILSKKVYNIAPFMEFHPGGEEELMYAAGRDGTQLFNELHSWVNYEKMLKPCFVGYYVGSLAELPPALPRPPDLEDPVASCTSALAHLQPSNNEEDASVTSTECLTSNAS